MSTKWFEKKHALGFETGFTLIELLVVVAIIAVLISILLPALNSARKDARAITCGSNLRSVGQAMASHLVENNGLYPCSYIYPYDTNGNYNLGNQAGIKNHPYGYLHWSYFLFSRGKVGPEAFQCPAMTNSGIPRTNPGPKAPDWEPNQVDQNGQTLPNPLVDNQAPRMAFTANAAIISRNKFQLGMEEPGIDVQNRVNKQVSDSAIEDPSRTILAAEFNKNWKTITAQGGNLLVKSHRSVNPFYNIMSGSNVYGDDKHMPFVYGTQSSDPNFGLVPMDQLQNVTGVIDGTTATDLNAVGRHHPGGDRLGGTANFLFADGHVERTTILNTIKQRLWGNKYYSLVGNQDVK